MSYQPYDEETAQEYDHRDQFQTYSLDMQLHSISASRGRNTLLIWIYSMNRPGS